MTTLPATIRRPSLRNWSLRARLLLFFTLLLLAAWGCAATLAWSEGRKYINEFFDTQQILLAKTLLSADWEPGMGHLPKTRRLLRDADKRSRGHEEDDALAFAVFNRQGQSLLTDGEKGARFQFEPEQRGFVHARLMDSSDEWRIFWVASPDGRRVVAVGQEQEFRQDMALDMLWEQMLPWALLLPVLSGGLYWMLHKELRTLRLVAQELEKRPPEDASPLPVAAMPPEVRPLMTALNNLFARTASLLQRERAFISDAAHELRTPLAGLRVQAEVVELYNDDEQARNHAVSQLLVGIERSTRLVDQLLALSRLDTQIAQIGPQQSKKQGSPALARESILWEPLLHQAVEEWKPQVLATQKRLELHIDPQSTPRLTEGYPALLGILLRNLLDNALKYTPPRSEIHIFLTADALSVENTGPGVPEALLPRLGERFFRPPGQDMPGSGLGLAMVQQIADLHGCTLCLENLKSPTQQGFAARLLFPHSYPNNFKVDEILA